MAQALTVEIYRSAKMGDCTNGGVSSKHDSALLIGETVSGPWDVEDAEKLNLPVLKLVRGNLTGTVKIIPADHDEKRWGMFGGNFAYTCDSRFGEAVRALTLSRDSGPVAIHDRYE